MFEALLAKFPRDPWTPAFTTADLAVPDIVGLGELFAELGGVSLGDGLYRVLSSADENVWRQRIGWAFPRYGHTLPFGFDWLGRVFALDRRREEHGQPGVVMLEPGTGDALEIPADLLTFHTEELIQNDEAAVATSFHRAWTASDRAPPLYDRCISYKIPLFLGGRDEIDNLEDSDVDVYWHVAGQLLTSARSGN